MDSTNSVVVSRNGDWKRAPASVNCVEDLCASASTVLLVKHAADTLDRHYPGWMWAIRPDEGGGIVDIFCIRISSKFGFTLHTRLLQEDPTMACVMRAGGEFLERFGFRRVRYSPEEWLRREAVLGQFIPDVTDMPKQRQRNFRTEVIQGALKAGHIQIATNDSIGAALAARQRAQHG